MTEYEDYAQICYNIIKEIYAIVKKLRDGPDIQMTLLYNYDYVNKCDEWLKANDALRQKIIGARERTLQHIRILKGGG